MRDNKGDNNNINVFEDLHIKDINENKGSIVFGTQIINNPKEEQEEINYDISKGKIDISRKAISNLGGTLSVAGALGFISNVISIFQFFFDEKPYNLKPLYYMAAISVILGLGLLHMSYELKRKKIISIFPNYIFGFELALFKDGKVAKLKLASTCPKKNCGGKLRFYYSIEEGKYYFICNRNKGQHKFEFDFTTLEY